MVGGEVIEESVVEYFHGAGTMLAGLEKVIEGLGAGDKKEGVVAARDAFGNPAAQPGKIIPRSEFPPDAVLDPGAEFAAKADNGQDVILQIDEVRDGEVHVRLLHPLAKKDIGYRVEVIAVTDPTPPPLPASAVAEAELEPDAEADADSSN